MRSASWFLCLQQYFGEMNGDSLLSDAIPILTTLELLIPIPFHSLQPIMHLVGWFVFKICKFFPK